MNTEEKNVYFQLLEKSQEAFVVAVELYNKPTIKYRVEGFAFFCVQRMGAYAQGKAVEG